MSEDEYLSALRPSAESNGSVTLQTLFVADNAVTQFPESSELWLLRGRVYCLALGSVDRTGDVIHSFEQAIRLNPRNAEAYRDLGDFYDGFLDDPVRAMTYYRKAE